jgi:hypothetical protein
MRPIYLAFAVFVVLLSSSESTLSPAIVVAVVIIVKSPPLSARNASNHRLVVVSKNEVNVVLPMISSVDTTNLTKHLKTRAKAPVDFRTLDDKVNKKSPADAGC